MRKLSCRRTGRDCEWEFIGENDDEVMRRALDHYRKMHGVEPPAEEQQRMRSLIHE